jgi:hypothetical protein
MIFIEAVIDKYDAPQLVLDSGHGMADVDYGPRAPAPARRPALNQTSVTVDTIFDRTRTPLTVWAERAGR